jgi:hypothetical protein
MGISFLQRTGVCTALEYKLSILRRMLLNVIASLNKYLLNGILMLFL